MMAKDKQAEDRLVKRQEMLAKKAEEAKRYVFQMSRR